MESFIKKLSKEEIKEFLQICDSVFIPPLSKKVNLDTYSEKLSMFSEHFCLFEDSKMVGLSCCYCNSINKEIAYLSVTCIHPNYLRKGLGKKITSFLEQEIKRRNFKKIRFEVDVSNIASQELHEKMGYMIVEKINNSYYMEKNIS